MDEGERVVGWGTDGMEGVGGASNRGRGDVMRSIQRCFVNGMCARDVRAVGTRRVWPWGSLLE